MRELLSPSDLEKMVGKSVELAGWVHDVRVLGGISFVLLRNSKGIVQLAAPKKEVTADLLELISGLHQEDVIECKGTVKSSKAARLGLEVVPEEIKVVSVASVPAAAFHTPRVPSVRACTPAIVPLGGHERSAPPASGSAILTYG